MKVIAKCHNYSGCLQAYRGEEIEIEPGAALVCPECGKAVTTVKSPGVRIARVAGAILLVAALLVGGFFAYRYFTRPTVPKTASATPAATPRPDEGGRGTAAPPFRARAEQVAEPPATVIAPAKIDLNVAQSENKQVKRDVLARIDVMPNVSQQNKDKLYNSVERAQRMGKVLTIPFTSGRTSLGAADLEALKTQLQSPEMMKLRDVPTAVFVVLGYADPKGNEKKNLEFSQARADAVLTAMRDKCGVVNVMHAVAMGGSTLLDAQNLEKNRIVEVWAVLP